MDFHLKKNHQTYAVLSIIENLSSLPLNGKILQEWSINSVHWTVLFSNNLKQCDPEVEADKQMLKIAPMSNRISFLQISWDKLQINIFTYQTLHTEESAYKLKEIKSTPFRKLQGTVLPFPRNS